jgi:hypothetical protein
MRPRRQPAWVPGPSTSPLEARAVPSGLGKRILGAVGVLLAVMGFIEVGLLVCLRIREGRGAESWVNAYGQTETWGSYGGSVVGALLILAGSAPRWVVATQEAIASGGRVCEGNSQGSQTRVMSDADLAHLRRASNKRWRGP